ncbi:primase-helicase family protein [Bacteroides thetaiotaomicron]|uniref:primase-helicase family protein n=1 Tax=Bacteroides thetaiotaomicron TaxID=818 RepID=UPI00321A8F20
MKGKNNNEKFIRVGTTLYKIVQQPALGGGFIEKRVIWNNETFKQDFGSGGLADIPKYDGFCTIPDHINYQPVVGKFLNLYEPIEHVTEPGECPLSLSLIRHIFGEQYEQGLDYIQLLYMQPAQKLPILLLVSRERNTGKSTFLNFLKAIFQGNMTFNTNEDFRSQFNSDWAGKLIIAVDEVLLNRREDSERLKNLSTAHSYKVEAKGKDRNEIHFFAKFVLCSNNESCPVIIDPSETRYWVRKVPAIEHDDTNFLKKLKEEIPHFLYFIKGRELSSCQMSRMWFSPALIYTTALQKIIRNNRNRLELELSELLLEIMDAVGVDKVSFCLKDLLPLLDYARIKADKNQIRRIIQEEWRLEAASNSLTYITYQYDFHRPEHYSPKKGTGRFYTVTREFLNHSDEMMKL